MEEEVRITIRLPRRLREALKRLAERERRSLNTYLVLELELVARSEGQEV